MKIPKELREKQELGGAVVKDKKCSIEACGEEAIRSLSEDKWGSVIKKAGGKYVENKQHKIYLCKKHYKEYNKEKKSEDKLVQKKGFLEKDRQQKMGKYFSGSDE